MENTNEEQINKEENVEKVEKVEKKEIESQLIESIKNRENPTKEKLEIAEEIDFKSIPDEVIKTDEYGFFSKETEEKPKDQKELLKLNARIEKWNDMIEHFNIYLTSKFSKLKERTRKGIPDSLRGYIWQKFAEIDKYKIENKYNELLNDKQPLDKATENVIIKDLDRTFPSNFFFKDKYGSGQRKLYHVLTCYSKFNKNTGYVQGMGFISALFLTYMDEESSFYLLHSLMKKYQLEGVYLPDFPELKKHFYVLLILLKKHLPKIYEVFKSCDMMPSMYASEWFITLFCRELNFKYLVRFFDVFLLEGRKIIYRIGLALLKLRENEFINAKKGGISSVMTVMHEIYSNIDIETLFKIAFKFSISKSFIKQCEDEYEKVKDDKKNEFISQL